MTKTAALYKFWSGFGIKAYASGTVPPDAEFPYLVYTQVFDRWGAQVSMPVNLWDYTASEATINAKAQEISNTIGDGVFVPYDGGAVLITCGNPFCQPMNDESNINLKRRYLNIIAEFMSQT